MGSDQVKKSEKNIKSKHGEIVKLHGTQPDITKRKSALEQSRKDWEIIFNAIPDWIIITDIEGRILFTNRAGESFTGKSSTEIVGQKSCKLVHGSDKHLPGCPLMKMLQTGRRTSAELHFKSTDRWLIVTVDPVRGEKGNLVGSVYITRDITDRKKAEKQLRESEARYKELFEQSPLGIGLATADGKVVHINKTMEVITGYFEEELKKIDLADTYENPEDIKRLLETIERYGCAVNFPVRKKHKDGTVYDALLNVSRVRFNGRELFQTICMDVTEQKKAQDELRQSEQSYRRLIETAQEGVWIIDTSAKTTYVNQQMATMLGFSQQEMLGRSLFDFMDEKASVEARKRFEQRKNGVSEQYDFRFQHRNGFDVWTIVNTNPIFDDKGRFSGALAMINNISSRKLAEDALLASEKKYRDLFENAREAIVITDLNGNILSINRMVEEYGYKKTELISKNLFDFVPKYNKARAMSDFENLVAGNPVKGEMDVITLKGTITVEYNDNPIELEGKVIGVQIILTDITARKRAEEAIKRSENKYRTLLENIPQKVFLKDSDSVYISCNENYACDLGIKSEEIAGKTDYEFYPKELADKYREDDQKVIRSEQRLDTDESYIQNGHKSIVHTVKIPVKDEQGNVSRVLGIFWDITALKQSEQKILEYQNSLRFLASELSATEERERRRIAEGLHDEIIQSLAFLDIKLDSLRNPDIKPDLTKSYCQMQETVRKLINMTRSFTFDLSSPVLYELGLEAAVEEWLVTNIEEKHAIATILEDDGSSKPLDDDMRAFLFKSVKELLINVVKHANASKVRVSISRDKSNIRICVEDNGVGFHPDKKRENLLDFSGFGLFSIRERLDYLQGYLDIESELGHGSRVTIVAPLKPEIIREKGGDNEHKDFDC